jgi:hypothetical protein
MWLDVDAFKRKPLTANGYNNCLPKIIPFAISPFILILCKQ